MADMPPPEMDYAEHDKTYALFLTLAKVSTVLIAIILIFMAIFLT